jgi:hypothetical protein
MNGYKFWKWFLAAGALLAMLLAACNSEQALKSPEGQALSAQGNAFMICLQDKDLQGVHDMMSPRVQRMMDFGMKIAEKFVDMGALLEQQASISAWNFERARIYTLNGTTVGSLDGGVVYVDGEKGKVRLDFEKDGGAWKVKGYTLQP